MSRRDREAVSRGLGQLFASEGGDLLESVIRSDRHRAGRAGSPPPGGGAAAEEPLPSYDTMTSPIVLSEYDNKTDPQTDNRASQQADRPASHTATVQAAKLPESPPGAAPKPTHTRKHRSVAEPTDFLAARIAEGRRLAQTPTTTVTLRLPRGLNDWLDEYVHRSWPRRVRKQELVAEALRLLFARRGRPGEPVLDTNFLPEDEP